MDGALAGLAPLLVALTDDDLVEEFGRGTVERGRAYARQRRVLNLAVTGGDTLTAKVVGSGHVYSTVVTLGGAAEPACGCTCPMEVDCKHAVAVIITARDGLPTTASAGSARPGPRLSVVPPPRPEWETVLSGMLVPPEASGYTPVALLVEPREHAGGLYGEDRTVLSLRPLTPGRTGWVKNGVTWNRLDAPRYYGPVHDPRHVQALLRLSGRGSGGYRWSGTPDWLPAADLDDDWLGALRACRRAGIPLLADQKERGEVVLLDHPLTMSLDVTRAPDGSVRVVPRVTAAGGEGRQEGWATFGRTETIGAWRREGDALVLAAFETPLAAAATRVLQHGPVGVEPGDADRFLGAVVPVLGRRVALVSSDASVDVTPVRPPRLGLRVVRSAGPRAELEWSFSYELGGRTLQVPLDPAEHAVVRDPAAEAALVARVVAAQPPVVPIQPASAGRAAALYPRSALVGFDVVRLVDETVPLLRALDGLDVELAGDDLVFAEAPEPPTVRLTLSEGDSGPDWFDLAVAVTVGGENVPIADLVRAFTLGTQHVILPSGTWFTVDRPELERLRQLVEEARALQDRPSGPLRLTPYHADLWAELEALGVVHEQSERWARMVKALTGEGLSPLDPPHGLRAALRPYQEEGYSWLTFLRRHGLGGILADDMGLGKTLQVLSMILRDRQEVVDGEVPPGPWLVVAPTSVLPTWASEAERFAPSLRVVPLAESSGRRGVPVAEAVEGADVVVTTYTVLRLGEEEFRGVRWRGLVLDEAQAVKNHQSVTYRCVRRLDAAVRFAVTGTPLENNLMELWALLSIAAPGMFPDPQRFTEHYRRPIESGSAPERLATLRRRIRPVMLRRTKQAVATDLPPKQEQVVRVDLPARHRRIYDRGLARERQRVLGLLDDPNRNRMAIFRSLTLLRQLSLHPGLVDAADREVACAKLDTLMDLLEPVLAEGHRALVFSQFTSFLALLKERLDAAGVTYAYLDGRTRRREQAIEAFRSGSTQVFVVSLKAGGTGLTLTEADYVFLLDPWWNPATEAQAVDRAHRIGQTRPVNVYRLVSADTIEDKVVALQERKRDLFASVVDEGALAGGALTPEDIRGLLG